MPRMCGYVKKFKVKEEDKDKGNKLMSFCIDDEQLLEKYKATWINTEDLKNIKLNALPVYDDRYRTYGDKFYSNFRGLNMPEDDKACESFTVISINSLLVYDKKYYLRVYLDNCTHTTLNKQMTDYLDENFLEG